jgi:hypothetical protein
MKKLSVLLLFAAMILLFAGNKTICQTTPEKNKPFFTIDVSGGLNLPLLELKGTGPKSFYEFQNYGVDVGPSIAIKVKMAVLTRQMLQLRLYFMTGYAHFTNEGTGLNMVAVPVGWPKNFTTPRDTTGISYIRFNQPYGGFGFEYAQYTDREGKSSFNFGLDAVMTWNTGRVYPTDNTSAEIFSTLRSNLRLGMGFNVFWNYRLSPLVGINLGSRFQFSNLIGKTSAETDESGYINLNDESNQALNPGLSSSRNVAFVGFFGGISFYFGKK